jgi:hypothetical protein
MRPHLTLGEHVVTVLLGAYGPFRRLDRWYWRLPWRQKVLYHLTLAALAVVGWTFASRFGPALVPAKPLRDDLRPNDRPQGLEAAFPGSPDPHRGQTALRAGSGTDASLAGTSAET